MFPLAGYQTKLKALVSPAAPGPVSPSWTMASSFRSEQFFLLWLVVDSKCDEGATSNAPFGGYLFGDILCSQRWGTKLLMEGKVIAVLQPQMEPLGEMES